MKKVKLFVVAMLASVALSAQISASSIVLMGGGGLGSSTSTTSGFGDDQTFKVNYSFMDLGVMYMITNPIGVGLALQASGSTSYSNDNKTSRDNLLGALIMARYYSACMAPRFYAYGQVDFGFGTGASRSYDNEGNEIEDERDNLSALNFGIRPGIAYFLTPSIMLEASFGALAWSQTTRTNDQDNDFKQTQSQLEFFAFSKSLQFGFCWWLGRKGQSFNQ